MSLRKTLLATCLVTALAGTASAGDLGVIITTDKGEIHLELYPDDAPVTVASFVNLAQRGYYDGLIFHRVISDFMVQGGDPTGTGSGGPGYMFEDEVPPNRLHDRPGRLSMAKTRPPHTNGSQFFITHKPTPWLDGKHTVFGQLTKGQDVVNAIAQGDRMKSVKVTGNPASVLKAQAARVAAWNAILDAKTPEEKTAAKAKEAELFGAAKKEIEQRRAKEREAQVAARAGADKVEGARQKAQALEFVKSQGVDVKGAKTSDSGLWYVVTKKGEGAMATRTNKVTAHASGYLADGKPFWSSHDRGEPMANAPVTGFVPGFTEGLTYMNAGSEAWLVIPGRMGYGDRGNPRAGIPGNATLVFKVELLSIQ